jgi:hypothetical protein
VPVQLWGVCLRTPAARPYDRVNHSRFVLLSTVTHLLLALQIARAKVETVSFSLGIGSGMGEKRGREREERE